MSGTPDHRLSEFPETKISETILDFARPFLPDLSTDVPERLLREVLRVSYTVWNAVVFADVLHDDSHLRELRRLTDGEAGPSMLVGHLIARKRELFGDDARLIGDWGLKCTPEGFSVYADARDPNDFVRRSTHRA